MDAKITINMDNAAFDGKTRSELGKCLRKLADTLDYTGKLNEDTKLPVFDSNGNTAGYLTIKE
jgi:hypothetical protein